MCKKTDKDLKARFIEFLKENNIYERFLKYGEERRGINSLTDYLDRVKDETWYLDAYFIFGSTKEGYDFWRKLNDKWLDVVRNNKKEEEEKVEEQKSEEKPEPKKDSNLKEKFDEFLKGAGVYRRFFLYLSEKRTKEMLDKYFNDALSDGWISGAFTWRDTDEGDEFWRSLSKDWKTLLKKEQDKPKKYKLIITLESTDENALIRDQEFIKNWNTSDVDIHFSDITENE